MLRFDGMPPEGIEIHFVFEISTPIRIYLVEESTGVPYLPGLATQPEPGTMVSPGEFNQSLPSDFTVIYRAFALPESTQ
jgi:hypothetical protein